jgi:hypothetical protein
MRLAGGGTKRSNPNRGVCGHPSDHSLRLVVRHLVGYVELREHVAPPKSPGILVAAESDHKIEGFKHIDILGKTITGVIQDFDSRRQHKPKTS